MYNSASLTLHLKIPSLFAFLLRDFTNSAFFCCLKVIVLALILCGCSHHSPALGLEVASFFVSCYVFFPFVSLTICLHNFFILPFWWNLFLLVDSLQ